MVHVVLTGATGLVGSAVLHHILNLPASASNPITKLSILSRSPVPAANTSSAPLPSRTNPKLQINVYNHTDYLTYPPDLLAKLSDASAVIWAQGISQTAVSSTEEYVRITQEFPLAAARALANARSSSSTTSITTTPDDAAAAAKSSPPPLNFIYVSGEGATHTPSRFPIPTPLFARVKGQAELSLLALSKQPEYAGKIAVFCPRPGGIWSADPKVWEESLSKRSFTMRWVMKTLLPVYRVLKPGMLIEAGELAGVLVEDLALRDGDGVGFGKEEVREKGLKGVGLEGRVLQNTALRELAGSGL